MNIQNAKVTVMGLGRFGGGIGVSRWLLDQGANVLLTDLASEEELAPQLELLGTHSKLHCMFGEHRIDDFLNADLVIANPAVPQPWNNIFLKAAWDNGVRVATEIELVTQRLGRKQVVGVTGTSGKSTTASMIHAALQASGVPSHLGGNIGGSLLNSINDIHKDDVVVLELSSAMLWWLERAGGWSPHVAVLTNIEENHIDWHESFEEYSRCKQLIFVNQTETDTALTQDLESTFAGLSVLGKHNERNAAIAFLAANEMGADATKARVGIQKFQGLPHRLQCIGDGYYNDSKSTTPLATKLAIDAFDNPSKVHLIVGGYDKKVDLSLLAKQSARVRSMYTIGETGQEIATLAQENVHVCETIERAVQTAINFLEDDEVLLLSPGCASWDQFENYEKRGERFSELVR
ncbi:MAG: hypothetical protein ISR75_03175 [Phycisphaerales bacterium]|nr:hypothetical protein [Planctomycetota bacterium]MBL6997424.1 hypothetical protein [Phycisphaerales bacterium]